MAHRIVIDVAHRFVYAGFYDCVTGAELIAIRQELTERPDFNPAYDVIVDLRNADLSAINSQQMQSVAAASAFAASARRAIVVGTTDQFGMARMYEIRRDIAGGSETTEIFPDLEDALHWLALKEIEPLTDDPLHDSGGLPPLTL